MSDQANLPVPKRRIESEESMASTSQYYSHVTSKEELQNLHLLYKESKDDSKDEDINSSEKTSIQFEALPPDWVTVRHCSGILVYMHLSTRICTVAKPYFLGKENTKCHNISMSSNLSIAPKKALDEEKKHLDIEKNQIKKMSDSADTNEVTEGTESQDIQKFESANNQSSEDGDEPRCPINNSAEQTEEFSSEQLNATAIQQVGNNQKSHGKATNRDLTMIVQGTSYLTIFHDMVRQIRHQTPVYKVEHIASETPYEVTAYVDSEKYGVGRGSNKRKAKDAAAREAIYTLLLQMIDELRIWKVTDLHGGNYLQVFRELFQLILQKIPVYIYKQTVGTKTPFEATAYVGDVKYGEGRGSNKRKAKAAAARDSVHTLVLQWMKEIDLHVTRPLANTLTCLAPLLRMYDSCSGKSCK